VIVSTDDEKDLKIVKINESLQSPSTKRIRFIRKGVTPRKLIGTVDVVYVSRTVASKQLGKYFVW